jgi:hypothetical protein
VTVFRQGSPIQTECSDDVAECDFQIRQQPFNWDGNFNNGDNVLENIKATDFDDSIHIQFPEGELVMGVATQIELVNTAPFFGRVRAYATPFVDGPPLFPGDLNNDPSDDEFLVEFIEAGVSCSANVDPSEIPPPLGTDDCLLGSAIYLGVSDTTPSIRRVSFGILVAGSAEDHGGINQVDIGVLKTTSVPEPGTLLLLTSGVLALACVRRRRPRR